MSEPWSDEELLDLAAQLRRSGVGRVHRTITANELVRVQAYRDALDILPIGGDVDGLVVRDNTFRWTEHPLHAEMEWR